MNTTDDLVVPAPKSQETPITGYPEGFWINLVSWSDDSKHIAFTIRSPGNQHLQTILSRLALLKLQKGGQCSMPCLGPAACLEKVASVHWLCCACVGEAATKL